MLEKINWYENPLQDIFQKVMEQPLVPIFDSSKARFASMCVQVSRGGHV